jgi:hypothetical protein
MTRAATQTIDHLTTKKTTPTFNLAQAESQQVLLKPTPPPTKFQIQLTLRSSNFFKWGRWQEAPDLLRIKKVTKEFYNWFCIA